ncbi:MAG: PPOX class probable FMN-dependent enzyme [Oceanospirillaceae bacterium]|jgi:PPOX class probable FMN-dependent enzyme
MYIESEEQIREIYGHAKGRAKEKQLASLERHSINFIAKSPFATIATAAKSGTLDCSPRGGKPGFVYVLNEQCILIPDSKGNNRLDSLVNIIETGKIACLFLIPGIDETLRVNGTARISTAEAHLSLFTDERIPLKSCIVIDIQEVFLHCAKALMRSDLWSQSIQIERNSFPNMGTMINDQLSIKEQPESQEEMLVRYKQDL